MTDGRTDLPPSRASLILAQQLRAYYASMKPAAIAGTLGPLMIAGMFWQQVAHWRPIVWWCGVAATLGAGSLLLRRHFLKHNRLPHDAAYWLRFATIRAVIVSVAFGSAGVLLFSVHSETHQIILFAWMVAISALTTVETANHRNFYWVTLLPMMLPFIVRAALHGEITALVLAISGVILLIYLLWGAHKMNRLIGESLDNGFANVELVAQLQEQMQIADAARSTAVEANQAKSRFLAAASHDLRQPIHALGLFVSAVRPHVPGEAGQRIVDKITSSVSATEVLFNALLDVSRLDAGILTPEVKPFALAPLLARLSVEYAPRAAARGLVLRTRLREYNVISDPTLLERIIRNYLGNAIRYTNRGGMLLGCRRRGNALRIELWDTGIGIPADKRNAIYEEFYQIGNAGRDRTKGLGLGLAIVKRIALLLGHPIDVASQPGRGSRFSIDVPLAPPGEMTDLAVDAAALVDDTLLVGACVMVIDDEADVREAAEVLLKQWGCLVLTADSGAQALVLLRRKDVAPDVIFSDYRLRDGETGIAAIAAIQQVYGNIPSVLITGDTAPDRLKEAATSGYLLLHKPLNAWRLKSVLCRTLRERSGLRSPVLRSANHPRGDFFRYCYYHGARAVRRCWAYCGDST